MRVSQKSKWWRHRIHNLMYQPRKLHLIMQHAWLHKCLKIMCVII